MPQLPLWRRNSEPTGHPQLDELLGDGRVSRAVPPEWQSVSELLQPQPQPQLPQQN